MQTKAFNFPMAAQYSEGPAFEPGSLEEKTFLELLGLGKSEVYAYSYATKIRDGEVFARHFAVIRSAGVILSKM